MQSKTTLTFEINSSGKLENDHLAPMNRLVHNGLNLNLAR
jgi:hypothetical protein